MSIRKPASNLKAPNEYIMPKGTVVHRIHLTRFGSASFNPCLGQPTRFAPIQDSSGNCVPSLYAGSNFEAAVFETLFHDVGTRGEVKTVPKRSLTERTHSAIQIKRDVRLAKLFAPDLKPWQISRQSLVGSSPAGIVKLLTPNLAGGSDCQ